MDQHSMSPETEGGGLIEGRWLCTMSIMAVGGLLSAPVSPLRCPALGTDEGIPLPTFADLCMIVQS